jgi:cullin 1
MDLALPQEMVEGIEAFKLFYEGDNKHRKLTWIYSQGTCVLKGNFDARPLEMVLSTLQVSACVEG